MSGKVEQRSVENDVVYLSNLSYAVKELEKAKIVGLIEPINNYSVPHYYMNSYDKGKSVFLKFQRLLNFIFNAI